MNLKQKLQQIQPSDCEWMGIREVRERTSHYYVRDSIPQVNASEETKGYMIEALVDGCFAYAATSNENLSALKNCATQAYTQAKTAAKFGVHTFSVQQRPQAIGNYQSSVSKDFSQMSASEINQLLIKICEKLKIKSHPKSDCIINTTGYIRLVEADFHYVCSKQSDAQQSFSLISNDFSATAKEGNIIQKRSFSEPDLGSVQAGLEIFDHPNFFHKIETVAEQALELLDAEECPTEACSLVLKPDQMLLQIHESVGHAIEIDRILGDERNYAGSSFVKLSDFGELQYGSKLMNISFDPTIKNQFASYAFDDSGNKAQKELMIQEGKLLRGLGSTESQARSGLAGVANARASSWNRAPIDRMANLNLEAGNSSFNDIITSVERGVLMETNNSWSIDDYRRKFQFGCEYGKLIENGKITKTLRNPNYRGISVPFWHSLKMLGDASTFEVHGTPYCGKGEPNQVIRVGHASPVCLFDNIEVFGGGA